MTLGLGSGSPLFSLSLVLIMLLALYQQIMAGWEARPPAPDRWGGLRRPAYKTPDISASGARGQNEEAQMKGKQTCLMTHFYFITLFYQCQPLFSNFP